MCIHRLVPFLIVLMLFSLSLGVLYAHAELSEKEASSVLLEWLEGARFYSVRSSCLALKSLGYKNAGYTLEVRSRGCPGKDDDALLGRWRVDARNSELYVQNDKGKFQAPAPHVTDGAPAHSKVAGELVSATRLDLDGDGQPETVEIVLSKGRRWKDAEGWCGEGDKWEGRFDIRTVKNGKTLWTGSLNALLSEKGKGSDDLFFWTPAFSLATGDYTGDGRPCFNLGQYGSCNGNVYYLFSVLPNGAIVGLPMDVPGLFLSDSKVNSTKKIKAAKGRIEWNYYDNAQGKEITVKLTWDGKKFAKK